MLKSVVEEWLHFHESSIIDLLWGCAVNMAELTEFELRLFEWIRQSDFETVAWSTKKAAKSFKCKEDDIYEGVAALTKKIPTRIQIYYEDGNLHIAAE